jgi:predicted nucleic acid-binding protein
LDIPVIGTLGVLVVAKTEGHLEAIRPAVRALRQAGLHVSDDIVNHVLQMAGEA